MNFYAPSERYYADNLTSNGEGQSASKYVQFRVISKQIPPYIEKLMLRYGEEFVGSIRQVKTREELLDLKEAVDDYLEDVQYRVIDRLDACDKKSLEVYLSMPFEAMVNKLNINVIEARIVEIITDYKLK